MSKPSRKPMDMYNHERSSQNIQETISLSCSIATFALFKHSFVQKNITLLSKPGQKFRLMSLSTR